MKLIGFFYRTFLKPFLFRKDPEIVHDRMLALGERLGRSSSARFLIAKTLRYENEVLCQRVCGIDFANPVGLAAGFDKNGKLTDILPCVGFGFEEIGSITYEPCAGNPKPRLGRLPKSRGIVVHYGLPNEGARQVLENLSGRSFAFPVGISIAKTNSPKTAEKNAGIADYAGGFALAAQSEVGDYITLNISCPNAYGGEPFTNARDLEDLLAVLSRIPNKKPIFIKLPADISESECGELLSVCKKYSMSGIIVSNLTKDRLSPAVDQNEIRASLPNGGISGKPTFEKSNKLIGFACEYFKNDFVIVGCGGIFSAEDAYLKIRLGASLVQLITGMIFEGPQLIAEINRGLVRMLKRDGFANIREAVGVDIA